MKKSLRVFVLITLTAGCAVPTAFAGTGGGNPSPIRNIFLSPTVAVILSLLGM
jgi:hypothetical protein